MHLIQTGERKTRGNREEGVLRGDQQHLFSLYEQLSQWQPLRDLRAALL